MTRKLLTLLSVLSLLSAACGSDGEAADGVAGGDGAVGADPEGSGDATALSPTTTTSTTTTIAESVGLTASWPGVTEDTIHLGFVAADLASLVEQGIIELNHGDPQIVIDALVADLNARGGILGRRVEPHLELYFPVGTTEADVACTRLSDDIGVFAVIGAFAASSASANSCFSELNGIVQVGGAPGPDQLAAATVPWLTEAMSFERRLTAAVDLMADAGLLGDRVATAVLTSEEALADDIVIPALAAHGVAVDKVVHHVPATDLTAGASLWQVFAERFRADGVDTVVLVETVAQFGSNQLVVNGFEGEILVVGGDSASVETLGVLEQSPPEALAGIIGTGGPTGSETLDGEEMQRCVSALESHDPSIEVRPSDTVPAGEPDWIPSLGTLCSQLRLFELAAIAAGAELTPESLRSGAESLGEIDLASAAFSSVGPDKFDASDSLRLVEFDPKKGESGGSIPFGPLVRVG